MIPVYVALIVFVCLFGGAMLGFLLQKFLPDHHLKAESKDAVKLGAGLIATMAALVLGILVGSAKSNFDGIHTSITQGGAKFIQLDHVLRQYGADGAPLRADLKDGAELFRDRIWPNNGKREAADPHNDISSVIEVLSGKIYELKPETQTQTYLKAEAVQLMNSLMEYRWLVLEQAQNTLPGVFLIVLLFWLGTLNFTYGLFAPRNGTVTAVLLICAISVASAIFLIMEMNRPMSGFIQIPKESFQKTLEFLDN